MPTLAPAAQVQTEPTFRDVDGQSVDMLDLWLMAQDGCEWERIGQRNCFAAPAADVMCRSCDAADSLATEFHP